MGKTGYTIICENCGKESYQTQTQYNRAKHHFCCNDCSIKFRSKKAKCIRQCEYCGKDMELNNSSNLLEITNEYMTGYLSNDDKLMGDF